MSGKLSLLLVGAFSFGLALGLSPAFAQESGGGGSKANLDLPVEAAGQEEEEEEAPEIVVFYGQEFEGNGIFFCCDKSRSMRGERWTRCQQEVLKNVTQFSDRVQFGIVFFDATIEKFPNTHKPAEATPGMKAAVQVWVKSIQTGAGSCYKEGLIHALNFANAATVKRRLIIVLGDGQVHCRGEDTGYEAKCLSEVRSRNSSGVKINTLCILCTSGANFMKTLAAQNGGTFAAVEG